MKSQRKAYLYAFAAIACWSTIGTAFKVSLRYIDFANLLLWSSLVAALIHAAFLSASMKWKLLLTSPARTWLIAAVSGFLNPFLYYLVLLKAYELLPAQEAGTLNYIWPLVLVLLSVPLLRQHISLWSFLAVLLSFSGILFISTGGNPLALKFTNLTGVLLATGSAVFWALYWIFNLRSPGDNHVKLMLNFSFGFLYTLVYILVSGSFSWPGLLGFTGSLYIGFFEMGITFLLWLNALKFSDTTARVSNLIYLSPFISLIFIHFIVGEAILWSTVFGLILIIGGIILQQYLKK